MFYLSKDYVYIIKSAFGSEFFLSLVFSIPFIFTILLFMFFLIINIHDEIFEYKNNKEPYNDSKIIGFKYLLYLLSLIMLILSIILIPNFKNIDYKKKYLNELIKIHVKDELKELKNSNTPIKQLRYKDIYNNRKKSENYVNFENNIVLKLKKIKSNKTVYIEDLDKLYNSLFISCFESNNKKYNLNENEYTLKTIHSLIQQRKEECMEQVTNQIVKENLFL